MILTKVREKRISRGRDRLAAVFLVTLGVLAEAPQIASENWQGSKSRMVHSTRILLE